MTHGLHLLKPEKETSSCCVNKENRQSAGAINTYGVEEFALDTVECLRSRNFYVILRRFLGLSDNPDLGAMLRRYFSGEYAKMMLDFFRFLRKVFCDSDISFECVELRVQCFWEECCHLRRLE